MSRAVSRSPAAMGKFMKLPSPVVEQIIKDLCSAQINHFDPVAVRDLQRVRLVSTALRDVATLFLFENFVWDQKFLRHKDIRRALEFARENPHLAKYVKRLQLRVPPVVTATLIGELMGPLERLRSMGITEAAEKRYLELMILPLRQWKTLAQDALLISGRPLEQLYQQSFRLFPKLEHIETATSTYYYEYLAMTSQKLAKETGIRIEDYGAGVPGNALLSEAQSLADAYALVPSTAHRGINSLKFCQVPLVEDLPRHFLLPTHIQYLDLEFKVPDDYTKRGNGQQMLRIAVKQWCQQLRSLRWLRSLHLSLVGTWDDVNNLAVQDTYQFYIDDLLPSCAPDTIHDRSGTFSYLTDLTLSNVPINPLGLRTFILKHRHTLENITLTRVSLDGRLDINWVHVCRMLSYVPSFRHLELWHIGLHYIGYVNDAGEVVHDPTDEEAQMLSRAVVQRVLEEDELDFLYDVAAGKIDAAERAREAETEGDAEWEFTMEPESYLDEDEDEEFF